MKLKLLLFTLIVSCGIMTAQDTVRSLIITEVSLWRADDSYIEFTNMGDSALHLKSFEFGRLDPWTEPWNTSANNRFMLPDTVLQPGETFLIATVLDFNDEQYKIQKAKFGYSPDYQEHMNHPIRWEIADMQIHIAEPNGDETDSISRIGDHDYSNTMITWGGRDTWFLVYYLPAGDSVLIDQFNGIFTEANGTRVDGAIDVAGVTDATNNTILMRKFTIKTGQTDFSLARGEDLEESEWMPVPRLNFDWPPVQMPFWTMGNHGAYNLDDTTLTSSTVDINWTDSIITVPWGTRNNDSVMMQMDKTEGLAWHYDYAETHEDSAFVSARTGDILTVYACGDDLDWIAFNIMVAAPTTGENRVVPKMTKDDDGWYDGGFVPYIVTDGEVMDSILDVPFGTRVDSLLKYLEKPSNAEWEIVWVDGNERTDLMLGDKLKVTAENSSVKEYYIELYEYREDRNAYLSSITWPDIPDYYRDLFGWIGDTIPNFVNTVGDYKVQVPWDVVGIPALVAKTEALNATLEVQRATNLAGSEADRTATFTSTAEDDTTVLEYNVLLEKQRKLTDVQPWITEPFFSQVVWQDQWANDFLEICNPGTDPLDLSQYMLVFIQTTNPATAIQAYTVDTLWGDRYGKYIPGYKWVDEATWPSNPGFAVQDLNVNALVMPGDVFVIGDIQEGQTGNSGYPWWASEQCDILFQDNPWNEEVGSWSALQRWHGYHYYMFKILNDSIHDGLKAANDPNDFELVEHWGMDTDGDNWVIGGVEVGQTTGYTRKPAFYEPTLGYPSDSWGTDEESSEWLMVNRPYYQALNVGWPNEILLICDGLGSHFLDEVTIYKSTVSSTSYLVDDGYQGELLIKGVVDSTSVDAFLLNIIKANVDQALTLISATSGLELTGTDLLIDGDTLSVLSADSVNTTKYTLDVTADGLSDNATLTSTAYTITVDSTTGTVSGFPYGTKLQTVVDGVTVPDGASFNVVDQNDAYVSMVMPNFDTIYVDVEVTDQIYFEVVSESGEVTILYQLKPDADSSDAFVTSTVYMVDQIKLLIDLLPQGTNVGSFLGNLTPAPGASMELIDKLGYTRESGTVVQDDKLVVTAANGVTQAVYYISMLPEDEGLKSDYLAYVLSDVYDVDQIQLHIISNLISTSTTVAEFLGNLIPVEGATTTVLNASGFEKPDGNLEVGDILQVTAANGVTVAFYTIESTVSVEDVGDNGILIYPNPSQGDINISGLEIGHRIRVFNSIGRLLRDVPAFQSEEIISLQNEANGIYFVVISKADSIVGRYKLIKQ